VEPNARRLLVGIARILVGIARIVACIFAGLNQTTQFAMDYSIVFVVYKG